MTDYQVPQHVQRNQQLRALARRPQPCLLCKQWTDTVLYAAGPHCPTCAANRGLQPVAQEVQT
jgi:hypothetical protein